MNDYPIPMEILCHECILNRYRCGGVFGDVTDIDSSALLSHVRCSVVHEVKADDRGVRTEKSGVVYYDCVNSSPVDICFLEDGFISEIVFKGESYRVTGVRYIYGASGLHHLEIELGC